MKLVNNLYRFNTIGGLEDINELINIECLNDKLIITNNNNITDGLKFYESDEENAISIIIDKMVIENDKLQVYKDDEELFTLFATNLDSLELDVREDDEGFTEITCVYKYSCDFSKVKQYKNEEVKEIEINIKELLPNYEIRLNDFLNSQIVEFNKLLLSFINPEIKVNGLLESITIVSPGVYPYDQSDKEEE